MKPISNTSFHVLIVSVVEEAFMPWGPLPFPLSRHPFPHHRPFPEQIGSDFFHHLCALRFVIYTKF